MISKAVVAAVLCLCPLLGQWRTGYYSSALADGGLAVENIYYAPFTHIVHYNSFPIVSEFSVSLDTKYYGVSNDANALINNAHVAGLRVLLSVGIGGADDVMAKATDSAHLSAFVDAIMQFVIDHGYDGVDIDWEGSRYGPARYSGQFHSLLAALRARLNTYTSKLRGKGQLAIFLGPPSLVAQNVQYVDQINVACYDDFSFSFTLVWHNAALYDPQNEGNGRACQNVVDAFAASGVELSRIGVGIPFYGYRWIGGVDLHGQGATYPGQALKTPATHDWRTYAAIVSDPTLWQKRYQHWDDNAKVPYLSIDSLGDRNHMFVTYENARSIAEKWRFVQQHVGGIAIYTIGGDWTPGGATVAEQHPLAEALRAAVTDTRQAPPIIRHRGYRYPHALRPLYILASLLLVYLFLRVSLRRRRPR